MKNNTRPLQNWERQGLIWTAKLSPTQKFVLLAYESYANADSHECFPSYATIAEKTGYKKRTVIEAVNELVALKILDKESRFRANGSQTSNNYRILYSTLSMMNQMHHASDPSTPQGDLNTPQGDPSAPPELIHLNNSNNCVYEAHTPDEDQDLAETQDLPEQPTPVNPDRSLIEGIDLGLDPENGLGAAAAKNLGGGGAKNALIPVVNAPVAVEKPVKVQTPSASSYCPVDINKWLQAWNESERPSKWPAMSIGMMSSQRTLDCLRQFIAHEDGDEDAAIATLINRLGNAKKDPFWKDRTVSAYFLTDPNKLFLAQFDVADPSPAPSVAPSPEPTANPNPTFFFGA